jgi:hypothetical protein
MYSIARFKMNILQETVKEIVVFYGYHSENLNEKFLENPRNEMFRSLFSDSELEKIHRDNIKVFFTSFLITFILQNINSLLSKYFSANCS